MYFTIITPCYKGVNTLYRTYKSLKAQTFCNFEWILVDDCSPDNGATEALINKIESEATFPLKKIFLPRNTGGFLPTKAGVEIAEGTFTAVLDQDDELTANALEIVHQYCEIYKQENLFAGVMGRCVNEKGTLVGKKFIHDIQYTYDWQIRFKQNMISELLSFNLTSLFKESLKKVTKPGHSNLTCWIELGEKYKYVYINEVLRIYDTNVEGSMSKSVLCTPITKLEGINEEFSLFINEKFKYYRYNLIYGLKIFLNLLLFRTIAKKNNIKLKQCLNICPKILFYLTNPLLRVILYYKLKI